ncbi:MAG: ATP-binding protein [Spirochaetia bacterium]
MEKDVFTINQDDCTHCGTCYNVCTYDAITDDCGTYTIDPDKCEACAMCVDQCSVDAVAAITVEV